MKLLLTFVLTLSSTAYAQNLKQDIKALLADIEIEVDYVDNRRTLKRTKKQLERTLDSLLGNTGSGSDPHPPNRTFLTCYSIDNDGWSPYQIESQDPRTPTYTKIAGSIFSSIDDCNWEMNKRIEIGSNVIM